MQAKKNIAARAARWSATHRKAAIFGWLAFVVVCALRSAAPSASRQLTDAEAVSGEAGRAEVAIERSKLTPNSEVVLVQSKRRRVERPGIQGGGRRSDAQASTRFRSVTRSARRPTAAARSPRTATRPWSNSRSRATTKQAEEKVDASLAATAAVQKRHPDVRVEQFGDASASKALEAVFEEDLSKAETTSLPVTLMILLLAFGALVAALVPLLIAFSAVLATMGLLALPSQLVPMDPNVSAVVVLVGLAVGVDYSLFYLRREREERRAGRSAAALAAARRRPPAGRSWSPG